MPAAEGLPVYLYGSTEETLARLIPALEAKFPALKIAGVEREFDARITEQHPDERVAWTSVDGPTHAGVVTFHRIDDQTSRVTLQMDVEPEGVVENVGTALGFLDRRVKGDLERFKEFIESRGVETGAWRGEVSRGTTT